MAEETKQPETAPQADQQGSAAKTYSEEEYTTLQSQLSALQSQLDTANTTIQSYKDMDIAGIKASVEDYKQKWEKSEADRKAFEHKTKLSNYVKSLGLQNDIYEAHVIGLLEKGNVQFSEKGELVDVDNIVETFKKTHADAFKSAEPPKSFAGHTPGFSGSASGDEMMDKLRKIYGINKKNQ